MANHIKTYNSQPVKISEIPVLTYKEFSQEVLAQLKNESCHCVNYYAVPWQGTGLRFFCIIADDNDASLSIFSHEIPTSQPKELESLTREHFPLHIYEREIKENFGVQFTGHPWDKPVRWPHNRADKNSVMDTYPFYSIDGEELHEVGVGPVHAGIIEPGHFRFICNGEKVLHLEIHIGYQHRGVERLFVEKNKLIQRTVLSESVAGDTTIGHSLAFAGLMEGLTGIKVSGELQTERSIALELERIAVHIGDTSALCTDVAYQFGQVVNEALRTTIINTTQLWCGNRFGKGFTRVGGTHYPLTAEVINAMKATLTDTGERYMQIADRIYTLPSVLARFDGIGAITHKQAELIGAVGMAARITGLKRDIRHSHPFQHFIKQNIEPVTLKTGDVLARGLLRKLEVEKSLQYIFDALKEFPENLTARKETPLNEIKLMPDSICVSLTEGWRGEICHCAITGNNGEIAHYKVKDPSLHNWMALALAVRNQEISDFPVCNKSFNLSYCGYDL